MKDLWKFIKSSGIYFVGTVLTKLVSFLLLPLYTSRISPAGYGIYDLYNTYMVFFCSVFFLDIWVGVMRFMFEQSGEDRKKPINCGSVIFIISSILYTIVFWILGPALNISCISYLIVCGLLMNVQSMIGYIVRGYGQNVLYASSGLIGVIVTTLFNVILLVYFEMDFRALFLASIIGYVVNIAIMLLGLKEKHIFSIRHFDKKLFLEMMKFSLPLCLNSVAYWFLTSYDRIVLNNVLGPEANGYYAIAGRFGSMVTLFTGCFHMAWQELAFSKSSQEQELGKFYSVAINSYIKIMGLGLIFLLPMISVLYPLLINNSYDVGKGLVPLYLIGTILSAIGTFLGHIFGAIKKNQMQFWTMLLGSIVNVVTIHVCIYKSGIQATNIALTFGFFALALSRLVLLKKELRICIDYKSILLIAIALFAVILVYIKGNLILNLFALIMALVVSLIIFRELVKKIVNEVMSRVKIRR